MKQQNGEKYLAKEEIQKQSKAGVQSTEDDEEHSCGFRTFRPQCLQHFNNPKFLLALLCAFAFVQGFVVNGINNVNTTAYERRFGLASSEVGLISSSYDISAGILVLPISYYGLRGHKMKMLTVGAAIMAAGSLLMSLPHFTTDQYAWGQNSTNLCSTGNTSECTQTESPLSSYLYAFIGGQLLHGAGGTTLYTIGIACIDDNVMPGTSALFVGIMYAFAALGPAMGYVLGGYFLDIYVDFDSMDSDNVLFWALVSALVIGGGISQQPRPSVSAATPLHLQSLELIQAPRTTRCSDNIWILTNTDARWVGAWWVGFVTALSLALLLLVPLMGLPRELPSGKEVRAKRVSEAHGDSGKEELGNSFKDAHKVLWSILRNPTLVFIALAASSEGIVLSGFATFIPKFIQNQYGQTASFSAILTGFLVVPGAVSGQIIGGAILRRFSLKIPGMLKLSLGTCLICLLTSAGFWAQCPQDNIAGVNIIYNNSTLQDVSPDVRSGCNMDCGCNLNTYLPVCGVDNVQYFSPCHAGCLKQEGQNFFNCSCIHTSEASPNVTHDAVTGNCGVTCDMMYVFLCLFFLTVTLTFVSGTPTTMVVLRCVPDSQKSFAIGVQWAFARFLGTIPGPILFGAVIDSSCLVWKEICTTRESCWIYDNTSMARNIFILGIGVKAVSSLFFFISLMVYKPPADKDITELEVSSPGIGEKYFSEIPHSDDGDLINDDADADEKQGVDNPLQVLY